MCLSPKVYFNLHQISLPSFSFAGLMSRDINRAQGPPPTLSLPSPPLIRGALQLQPAERRAALSCLFSEDAPGPRRAFSPARTSPRRDETLPCCRDRRGSADKCVSAACFASCKFQHLGEQECLLRSRNLMRLKHFPLYCRESSASSRERRAERRRGMVLSHSLCVLRYFMWVKCANTLFAAGSKMFGGGPVQSSLQTRFPA